MTNDSSDAERTQALKRIEARRAFWTHLATYVLVNAFLVVLWATQGVGYFWPIWPILGWGIGIVFHAWDTFFKKPVSESAIQREIDKMRDER